MGIFDNSFYGDPGHTLATELIQALGLDDSSQGGMFDKSYTSGYEYYAGLHIGVCHGPVDVITEILFKGKVAWSGRAEYGNATIDNPGFNLPVPRDQENPWDGAPQAQVDTVVINQPSLFGGEKVEGGVLGIINVLHGGREQGVNNYLNTKLRSKNPAVYTPAYRGILSLVFHSDINSGKQYVPQWWLTELSPLLSLNRTSKLSEPVTHHTGFHWGAMSPSLKEVSVRLFRAIQGWNNAGGVGCWYPEKCIVTRYENDDPLKPKRFMNAAHITVQCLTDLRFGMKIPMEMIGPSFLRCADQLWDQKWYDDEGDTWVTNYYTDEYDLTQPCEGIGLGIVWSGENSIRAFLSDIMRYINGNVYIDHSTGKLEMVLIRKVPISMVDSLPLLTPSQIIDIGTFGRPTGEEAVNTISVIYSDYETEKTETVTRSNTAMVAIYETVISETLSLPGIKNRQLAAEVCEREVRQRCSLAGTYSRMQVTKGIPANGDEGKAAFTLYEGAPFRLNWPKHNVSEQVFRVSNINYGTMTDNFIEFDAIEDVFGLVDSAFIEGAPASGWDDTNAMPQPLTAPEVRPFAVPYTLLLSSGGSPMINVLSEDAGLFGVLANTASAAVTGINLFSNNGELPPDRYSPTDPAIYIGSGALCPTSFLDAALPVMSAVPGELQHTVKIAAAGMSRMAPSTVEGAWFIVDDEKIRCVSIVQDENDPDYLLMTLERGIYDTVPAEHNAGATMWWFNGASSSAAWSSYARYTEGDPVRIFVAPYGSGGGITLGESTYYTDIDADNAWFAPYPPANVKINGQYFPSSIQGEDFTVEWACRNRVSQSDVALPWDAPGVDPEPGTTFTVRVFDSADDPLVDPAIAEQTGIDAFGSTGYYRYTGGRGPGPGYIIQIEAVRNGKKSTQLFTHTTARFTGYGLSYGYNYSGGAYAGVDLQFGETPPPVVIPTAGVGCPRPAWVAGDWMSLDATVAADGGIGYSAQPSALYDFYHVVNASLLTEATFDAGAKPYRHRLQCSDGGPGGDALVILSDGDSIWKRRLLTTGWAVAPKPSVGLFSSPGTVDSVSHNGTQFVVCMNKGADIYTAVDSSELDGTNYVRKGTASESNELLDLLQAEWIQKIGSNYVACGKAISDYTKTAIASSTDLINWTLRTTEAPVEALDSRNWVWFNGKFYVFSTVGDPTTGSVFAMATTNGWTFTAKSMGAPPHTPVVGRGFAYAISSTDDRLQVFGGAYLFTSTNGTAWAKQRTVYAPEQILKAMASPEPFIDNWAGDDNNAAHLESKGLLLRSGRYLYDSTAPDGHPGRVFLGGLMSLPGFDTAYAVGTQPELIQPTSLPYGNRVGALGDSSSGLTDAGFSNGGSTSDDVYGLIGREGSGKWYFEVHVGSEGTVLVGVTAALGLSEVAPVSSAILTGTDKIITGIRLACPGGLTGLNSASVTANTPTLANAVVGVLLDLDNLECSIFVNGEHIKTIVGLTAGLVWFPVFTSISVPLKLNLGQAVFQALPPSVPDAWLS